jgi:putative phage-type endonuclease
MTALSKEQWLEERKKHIGASEVAAILGADPRYTPLHVYESKVHDRESIDTVWMKFGRDVEGAIANAYAHETGRSVVDLGATAFQYHPDMPFLAATLDRVTWDKPRDPEEPGVPLELKNKGDFTRPDAWVEEPPLENQIQLQIQMSCKVAPWGSLCAMFPGYQIRWRDFERDEDFLAAAYPELERFRKCVVDKTPPPVQSDRCLEVIKRLYSQESGETVALGRDEMVLADSLIVAKEHKKDAEKQVKEIEAKLRGALGENTFGALPDGTFLTLKTTHRKAYTREVEAGSYRTLRRAKKI